MNLVIRNDAQIVRADTRSWEDRRGRTQKAVSSSNSPLPHRYLAEQHCARGLSVVDTETEPLARAGVRALAGGGESRRGRSRTRAGVQGKVASERARETGWLGGWAKVGG